MKSCIETLQKCQSLGEQCTECIDDEQPNFYCEGEICSPHSPGVVRDSEDLIFLLINPTHYDEIRGVITPDAFRELTKRDLSVLRAEHATEDELKLTISKLTRLRGAEAVKSRDISEVCVFEAEQVRSVRLNGERLFAVYDTALEDARSHAGIFTTRVFRDNKNIRKQVLSRFYDLFGPTIRPMVQLTSRQRA